MARRLAAQPARRIAGHLQPGMIMLLTETLLAPANRSGEDFVTLNIADA